MRQRHGTYASLIGLPSHGPAVEVEWISSLFLFLGGGQRLLLAMYNAMVADAVTVMYRYVDTHGDSHSR
jgi:hypothetical protein